MSYGKSIDFLFNQMRNGSVGSLAGGSIIFYAAGTTTPKPVWLNVGMTSPSVAGILTPYTLSADGTAELFGTGLYDVVIKDSTGVIIYDYSTVEITSTTLLPSTTGLLFVSDVSLSAALVLPLAYNVTVVRTDANGGSVEVVAPTAHTFADGLRQYLYLQNETLNYILDGTKYYLV